MPESRTSLRRIAAVERQRQALEMRAGEQTFEEISRTLGYKSRSAAKYAVETALDRVPAPEAVNFKEAEPSSA